MADSTAFPPTDNKHFIALYLSQIEAACRDFDDAMARLVRPHWRDVDLALMYALRVANYLLPRSNDMRARCRGEVLRAELNLLHIDFDRLVKVRNKFEHIDEKMDAWWLRSATH